MRSSEPGEGAQERPQDRERASGRHAERRSGGCWGERSMVPASGSHPSQTHPGGVAWLCSH